MFAEPFARNLFGLPGINLMSQITLIEEFKTANICFIENLENKKSRELPLTGSPVQLSNDRGYPERSSKHEKNLVD
jgi:hypothetical protein